MPKKKLTLIVDKDIFTSSQSILHQPQFLPINPTFLLLTGKKVLPYGCEHEFTSKKY